MLEISRILQICFAREMPDAPNIFEQEGTSADLEGSFNSPVKTNFVPHEVKTSACEQKAENVPGFIYRAKGAAKPGTESTSSSESDDYRWRKRKRKRQSRKLKEKRRRRSSSSSSDEPECANRSNNLYHQTALPVHAQHFALNTAYMPVNSGMHFKNTYTTCEQPPNFANMFPNIPVLIPMAYQ